MIKSYEITPDKIRIAVRAIKAEAEYNLDQNRHLLMDIKMDEKTSQRMFEIICRITSTYKYQFAIDIAKRAMESCCIVQCREQCSRFCTMCKRPITNFFFYV